MLQYFKCEQKCIHKWHLNSYHHNPVGKLVIIPAKEFTLDVDSGYKDAAHIQNDLLTGRLIRSYLNADKIALKLL